MHNAPWKTSGPTDACPNSGSNLILEVDGPGTGTVGLKLGPLVRFDLSAPMVTGPPLIPDTLLCRNARTTLADGIELVTYESASKVEKIGSPLLVVHGADDSLIKPELGRMLHSTAHDRHRIAGLFRLVNRYIYRICDNL